MDQGKHSLAMLETFTSGRKFQPDSVADRKNPPSSGAGQLVDMDESK
jgi:hypothetical protein